MPRLKIAWQANDGGGLAKGGMDPLYVNDKKVAQGRIERVQPMVFFADETADVGIDLATPLMEAIGAEGKLPFTGRIRKVVVEVKRRPASTLEIMGHESR